MIFNSIDIYGLVEIPNEELDVIVQEGEKIPTKTPKPSQGQYEYDAEKYKSEAISGSNQSGNAQSGNSQSVNNQSGNSQSGSNQNVNSQSGSSQNVNNQSGNSQSGSNQNVNNQSGNSQSTNNQSGNSQSTNNQSGNSQSTNNQSGNSQSTNNQNGYSQSTHNQSGNSQSGNNQNIYKQSGNSQSGNNQNIYNQSGNINKQNQSISNVPSMISQKENATECIENPEDLQENMDSQEVSVQQTNDTELRKQAILNKIASVDMQLETFTKEDVLSENPRSELYDNSNYAIMSKNGEFLSIMAVMIVLLIVLAMKLH